MDVRETVDRLIQDMRSAAVRRDLAGYDAKSDELAVFVRAYAEPVPVDYWPGIHLTPKERRIADVLRARLGKETSRDAVLNAMYFDSPEGEPESTRSTLGVLIHRVRRKLAGTNYRVENLWGHGFRMVECPPGAPLTTYTKMTGANHQAAA